MPSGAKKRKAAKKKKTKEVTRSTSTSTLNHDDDSKDHNGEEVQVEKTEDCPSLELVQPENQSREEEIAEKGDNGENVEVQIDKVLKTENDLEGKDSSGSSSSSSSSSEDESLVDKQKPVVLETAPDVDLDQPEQNELTCVKDEVLEETLPSVDSSSEVVPQMIDNIVIGKTDDEIVESPSFTEMEVVVKESCLVDESSLSENSSTSGVIVSTLKVNGVTKSVSLDENTDISPVSVGLESHKKEAEVVLTSDDNTLPKDIIPEANEEKLSLSTNEGTISEENEEKLLLSTNAPSDDPTNGEEQVKQSDDHNFSNGQPLLGSAPRAGQTTSWKSCCGILELFSGSSRI